MTEPLDNPATPDDELDPIDPQPEQPAGEPVVEPEPDPVDIGEVDPEDPAEDVPANDPIPQDLPDDED